jgi:hypothetical protein
MWDLINSILHLGGFVLLGLGLFSGYHIGVWRAETGRAWFDMSRIWDNRSAWRSRDF